MAQVSMATSPMVLGASSQTSTLAADDLRQIQEYDRIVRFRDSILSGNHPRIKVPSQAGGKVQSKQQGARNNPAPSTAHESQGGLVTNDYRTDNLESFKANSQQTSVAGSNVGTSKAFGLAGKTQIDPLLLTKSDELIKAELHLQRQRLERSIREEFDERRAASKSTLPPSEQASEFDLSDILAKALTLVQATAPPPLPANANMVANASDSSDSFDENSYYSSQHDTPEPSPKPQTHNSPEDTQMRDASSFPQQPSQPHGVNASTTVPNLAPSPFLPPDNGHRTLPPTQLASSAAVYAINDGARARPQDPSPYPPYSSRQSLIEQARRGNEMRAQVISSNGSGTTSRSDDSGIADLEQRVNHQRPQASHRLAQSNVFGHGEPVVRAHNLSPVAPQPAHVSPLATARQPPVPDLDFSILRAAPAPVAALRQDQGNGTSPDSSPHGEKGGKKKKNKKSKRKAAEATRPADRPASPYIKPEPRSPSPFSTPQFARTHKRQRPSTLPQHNLNYDDPRLERPVEVIRDEYPSRSFREERVPIAYERVDNPYAPQARHSIAPSSQRLEQSIYEERRTEENVQYVRRVQSPPGYPMQYAPGEIRPMRSATYSVADPIYREAPPYRRDRRMSVRPVGDRARSRSPVMLEARSNTMAPPRPPTRIVRDELGREYLEPLPLPPASRHSVIPDSSVVPAGRPSQHEVIYERASMRATSRMPGPEAFERDGALYRRASPAPVPRRVITQPQYSTVDHREYRQRDYSAHPAPVPAIAQDLAPYRGEGRLPPREVVPEYGMRSASVRPIEHVRYDYPRVSSVRPDMPVREYAGSVYPDSRQPPPVYREYSARPAAEPELPRREYSTRPVERYYERPVVQEDEVQFIEQPRTLQREIIYEDGRREVFR
ncbi:hypothetical protein BJ170DRAFT_613517 [Xylariales sp. AK1849]|nr:hypothetical protein BJ170DRAFT_613517 [Xylariales sp. AK1849]